MLARSNATPAKIPRSHIIKRACPSARETTASMVCGTAIARPGFTFVSADCTGLTDQTNFLSVGGVVFIEVTAREKRHFPRLEISGSNLVTRHDLTLLDRRNITIAPRIKITTETDQRNVAADGRALEPGNTAQLTQCLFNKTLTRRAVRVLRRRQCNRTRPKILGTEAEVLLTQADEARDEQCCADQ